MKSGAQQSSSRFNLTVLTRNLETTITPFTHPAENTMLFHLYAGLRPKISGNYLIECNGLSGTRVEKLEHLAATRVGGGEEGLEKSRVVKWLRGMEEKLVTDKEEFFDV